MRIKSFCIRPQLIFLAAAVLTAGCGDSEDSLAATGGAGGTPSGAAGNAGAGGGHNWLPLAAGKELHVVPGSPAALADGSEAHPFASIYDALSSMEAAGGVWDGTVIMHPTAHELRTTVVLPKTVDLKVLAGTTFKMGPLVAIHAQRDVKMLGTEESQILFTWLEEGKHWESFTNFEPTSKENVFEYVIFEHGYETQFNSLSVRGALGLYYAAGRVSHCTFQNNEGDDGLTLNKSDSLVEYSTFLNNASDAVDDGGSHAEIAYSYFEGNPNDAVDLGDGTSAWVHDNIMYKNGDKGVSIGETSPEPRIEHNLIVGNAIGIGIKDGSTPIIWNNTLYGNDYGVSSSEAIAGLGAGKGSFTGGIIWHSLTADLSLAADSGTVFSYTCIERVTDADGNKLVDGVGITSPGNGCDDPLFADPENPDPKKQDFHLRSVAGRWDPTTSSWILDQQTSPCIDTGDPTAEYGKEPAPNGSRINMGRYGGTDQASKSP